MAHARNYSLDKWDPMEESYRDANINSYDSGPGGNLTPHAGPSPNSEWKLYVSQIPAELTEKGIQQVFRCHGTPTSVMSPPFAGWAFVTFSSFREAETAIRELNAKPPLNLLVTFAKKRENESNRRNFVQHRIPNMEPVPHSAAPILDNHQRREFINPEQRVLLSKPMMRNMERGKELAALVRRNIAPPRHLYSAHDDLLYPVIHDPNIYDPYEDAEPYSDTNNMWTRGRVQMAGDGMRYVTMGRGYTCYELPTPHPRVNQQIRAVYENREAGSYEYGENKLAPQIGRCQYCAKPAIMRCQRCREFYCSRLCQEYDWQRHKVECQAMPGLEGGDSASISISSGEETPVQVPAKQNICKLRRPLITPAPPTGPNSMLIPIPPIPLKTEMPENTLNPKEKENDSFPSNNNFKRTHLENQKRVFNQNKTSNTGVWKTQKNGEGNQVLRSCTIQNKGQNESQTPSLLSGLPSSLFKQDKETKQEPRKTSPQGNFVNKNFKSQNAVPPTRMTETQQPPNQTNNNLNRGSPALKNQQVKSNINVNKETAKPTPKPLLPDPDVAFYKASEAPKATSSILLPRVSFQVGQSKTVAEPSGTQTIPTQVDENKKVPAPTENKTATANPLAASVPPSKARKETKNIVELLDADEEGCFEAHVLLGAKKAAVTVCVLKFKEEYAKISSELTSMCEKMPSSPSFKPKVGDFVCGKRLDDWIRGTITSLGPPMRLAAADEGRVEPVTSLKPVPRGFVDLPTLGGICEMTEGDFKLESMGQYTFLVVNNNPETIGKDGVEIVLFSADEKEGKGFLKSWTPTPEQKGIPYATLTSRTEVCLTSFRSHVLLFARSLLPKDMEIFNRLTQDVARCSTQASNLTESPIEGEMVIAKFMDGNFYRAIVRKINDNKITVSYVDYGNIETTALDNLKPISQKLKEYPSCAAKIVLKDVPKDVPMTKEVNDYLGNLVGSEKSLMCTFEGCPSTDGVILKTANGISVNAKVNELLTPNWKKEEDKTSVFMVGALEVAELGTVGETVNVIALYSYGSLMHAMAPQDAELINHVTGVMAMQIEEYCKQLTENYIPRQSELCLAPFEGTWYRAVCLEPSTTLTTSTVNFIDFGNVEEIPHKDLKLFNKDFMSTKTLANICQVVGLGPVDDEGELPPAIAARVEKLVLPNSVVLVKIVECTKPGEYKIELPLVKEILVTEGLLKV